MFRALSTPYIFNGPSCVVMVTDQRRIGEKFEIWIFKIEKCIFLKFPRCTSLWKAGYRNRKWPWKPGYRNRMCLSNIGTGTEYVLQILVPEQNVSFKYWYRNKMCPSNIGTGTKIYFRYERSSFKKRLIGTIQNLYERHFRLILNFLTSRFENTPQFGPCKDHLSENRNLIGTIQSRIWRSINLILKYCT